MARRKKHPIRRILALLLLVAAGAGAWLYLQPFLTTETTMQYESYTAGRGNIETTKSFSATLSAADSEILYNDTNAESVRKLYVTGGQEVKEGDTLLELSDGTVLEAGIDGMVNEIRYSEGDWLRPGVQLVEICDLNNLEASLQIDEYDIDQISVGQKCTMTIVPLNVSFETQLNHVSRLSTSTGRVAYYSATAQIAAPESVLPGMTTSVTLPDQQVTDVVTLDMAALSFDEEDQPYVLRQTANGYERLSVETGLSNGMQVEIRSGLSQGDVVWKEAGAIEADTDFSLGKIYARIFGETVVINEPRGSGAGRGGFSGEFPADLPEGMSLPEGMTLPEGMEDMTLPEGMTPPEEMASPQATESAAAAEADSTAAPQASAAPEETAAPQGSFPGSERPADMPEGMTLPEGMTPPEGMSFPQGMEGMTPPQDGQRPDGSGAGRSGP